MNSATYRNVPDDLLYRPAGARQRASEETGRQQQKRVVYQLPSSNRLLRHLVRPHMHAPSGLPETSGLQGGQHFMLPSSGLGSGYSVISAQNPNPAFPIQRSGLQPMFLHRSGEGLPLGRPFPSPVFSTIERPPGQVSQRVGTWDFRSGVSPMSHKPQILRRDGFGREQTFSDPELGSSSPNSRASQDGFGQFARQASPGVQNRSWVGLHVSPSEGQSSLPRRISFEGQGEQFGAFAPPTGAKETGNKHVDLATGKSYPIYEETGGRLLGGERVPCYFWQDASGTKHRCSEQEAQGRGAPVYSTRTNAPRSSVGLEVHTLGDISERSSSHGAAKAQSAAPRPLFQGSGEKLRGSDPIKGAKDTGHKHIDLATGESYPIYEETGGRLLGGERVPFYFWQDASGTKHSCSDPIKGAKDTGHKHIDLATGESYHIYEETGGRLLGGERVPCYFWQDASGMKHRCSAQEAQGRGAPVYSTRTNAPRSSVGLEVHTLGDISERSSSHGAAEAQSADPRPLFQGSGEKLRGSDPIKGAKDTGHKHIDLATGKSYPIYEEAEGRLLGGERVPFYFWQDASGTKHRCSEPSGYRSPLHHPSGQGTETRKEVAHQPPGPRQQQGAEPHLNLGPLGSQAFPSSALPRGASRELRSASVDRSPSKRAWGDEELAAALQVRRGRSASVPNLASKASQLNEKGPSSGEASVGGSPRFRPFNKKDAVAESDKSATRQPGKAGPSGLSPRDSSAHSTSSYKTKMVSGSGDTESGPPASSQTGAASENPASGRGLRSLPVLITPDGEKIYVLKEDPVNGPICAILAEGSEEGITTFGEGHLIPCEAKRADYDEKVWAIQTPGNRRFSVRYVSGLQEDKKWQFVNWVEESGGHLSKVFCSPLQTIQERILDLGGGRAVPEGWEDSLKPLSADQVVWSRSALTSAECLTTLSGQRLFHCGVKGQPTASNPQGIEFAWLALDEETQQLKRCPSQYRVLDRRAGGSVVSEAVFAPSGELLLRTYDPNDKEGGQPGFPPDPNAKEWEWQGFPPGPVKNQGWPVSLERRLLKFIPSASSLQVQIVDPKPTDRICRAPSDLADLLEGLKVGLGAGGAPCPRGRLVSGIASALNATENFGEILAKLKESEKGKKWSPQEMETLERSLQPDKTSSDKLFEALASAFPRLAEKDQVVECKKVVEQWRVSFRKSVAEAISELS